MPFISSLDKNIWAHYIPPYPDELFSSWFFRLSQAHHVKSHSFGRYYFKNQQFWNRDVDNMPSQYLKDIIFNNTPLNYSSISQLFLTSYESFLFESHNPFGRTMGILPLGIMHRKRKNNGLLFCPLCLKKHPYYRKSWRIFVSYICCKCRVLLRDSCPVCNEPIAFHRLEQGDKNKIQTHSLNHCSFCLYDLSSEYKMASSLQLDYQQKINTILHQGFTENYSYSFAYFKLLSSVAGLLSRRHTIWGRLRYACENEFGYLPENSESIDLWNIDNRRIIFEMAFKVVDNPDILLFLIKEYNLRLSEFNKDHSLPFFFENIFKSNYL
ncbi:TniQ family protein [Chryseobacterium sp. MIQD13]|uniref:TniQ family protein n=1 Tax=Chryseobacterium sp. MIQD13 TaxID=3422310 RepID=UPI003D2A6C38